MPELKSLLNRVYSQIQYIYRFEGNRIFIHFSRGGMIFFFTLSGIVFIWCWYIQVYFIAVALDGFLQLSQMLENISLMTILPQGTTLSQVVILCNSFT